MAVRADTDTGFIDYPNLAEKASALKTKLDAVSYGVNVGFGWNWLHKLPEADEAPWQFLAISSAAPLTRFELPVYLEAAKRPNLRRWIVLEPLARDEYSTEIRILDLVHRMMAAKIHGAEAIFVPDPIGSRHGLLRDDGTPGELFLPWRTTALMLASAKYAGSIQLPGGSENHIFTRENDAVMVVWNRTPGEEVLYLGENVRQTDLWGVETALDMGASIPGSAVGLLRLLSRVKPGHRPLAPEFHLRPAANSQHLRPASTATGSRSGTRSIGPSPSRRGS